MAAHLKDFKTTKIDKKKRREELEEQLKPSWDEYEGFIKSCDDSDREMTYAWRESIKFRENGRGQKFKSLLVDTMMRVW